MSLDEKAVLQRLPSLTVEAEPGGLVVVTRERRVEVGPHGLAVLDAFREPVTVEEAMARLRGRSTGMQDWLDLIGTVEALRLARVLVEPDAPELDAGDNLHAGTARFHATMLDDRDRTSRFIEAIESEVGPDDVVLDIGTGTGVLAMAAARAGARHVYAVEAGEIASVAEAHFRKNGLADRITLVRGWSTQVTLPERATLLVSETIGAQPFEERVLELTRDAFSRLLTEGARMIPSRLRIFGQPVRRPEEPDAPAPIDAGAVARWREWYGLDFSELELRSPDEVVFVQLSDSTVAGLESPGLPALLGQIDLAAHRAIVFEGEGTVSVDRTATVGGVAIFFEMDLADGVVLSNAPSGAGGTNHWANPVGILPTPFQAVEGDRIRIRYAYGGMTSELGCEVVSG